MNGAPDAERGMENEQRPLEYARADRQRHRWMRLVAVALLAFNYGWLTLAWVYTLTSDLRNEVFAAEWGNHGPWRHFGFVNGICAWAPISAMVALLLGFNEMERSRRAGLTIVLLSVVYLVLLLLHVPMVD